MQIQTSAGDPAFAVAQAKQQARGAAAEAVPWVDRLARLGYAARGVVYMVVGGLALLAALGLGGKKTGTSGALATIAALPLGQVLLAVLALGLMGYTLWRFVEAIADPENKGTDLKGLTKRAGYFISGCVYTGLAYTAVRIGWGAAQATEGGSTQDATARLMSQPLGQWLVGAVGLGILAVGANTLYIALKEKFCHKLRLDEMSPSELRWATLVGKVGLSARAAVSAIVGFFLIASALHANPNEARGLDGALKVVAQQPYGKWLLGLVAVGLVAFGLYSLVEAKYRPVLKPRS